MEINTQPAFLDSLVNRRRTQKKSHAATAEKFCRKLTRPETYWNKTNKRKEKKAKYKKKNKVSMNLIYE